MIASLVACAAMTIQILMPLDRPKMLEAIAKVEAWDGKTKGKAGEWGRYQMTPGIFHQYVRLPVGVTVRTATHAQLHEAAVKHLDWIIDALTEHKLPVNAYTVGLAWGAGFEAVRTNSASAMKRDYAQRCANLYWENP